MCPSKPQKEEIPFKRHTLPVPNSNPMHSTPILLCDRAQKLRLKDEFPLLVLLRTLIRLIVLPSHRLLALPTMDIAHDVAARRHVTLAGLAFGDVDDGVEEVGFAVLAAEVLLHRYVSINEGKGQ